MRDKVYNNLKKWKEFKDKAMGWCTIEEYEHLRERIADDLEFAYMLNYIDRGQVMELADLLEVEVLV